VAKAVARGLSVGLSERIERDNGARRRCANFTRQELHERVALGALLAAISRLWELAKLQVHTFGLASVGHHQRRDF
jgi:hypothetical protein